MANQYLYDLTDTWDSAGTTFDAIKINVTNTNSATASKLLDLQVGGVSKFKVLRDGDVTLTGPITGATSITGSGTVTADRITVTKTTANAPAISSTGYSLTGSDASSLVDLAGTWNTSGTPTAIKLNVTDTASNSASLLMDLQVGGSSKLQLRKDGYCFVDKLRFLSYTPGTHYFGGVSNGWGWNSSGVTACGYVSDTFFLDNSKSISWVGDPSNLASSVNLVLTRDAANTLAQRNGTNAQTFNLYSTSSSSNANYERLSLISQAAGAFRIHTQKAGTGSAQALELGTDGTTRLTITTGGNVTLSATGAGIQLPSGGYLSIGGNGLLNAPSDGVFRLTNNAQNDWGRLQFGGTTSSFPALKRSSAALVVRLADDSANAALESASLKTDAPAGGTAATWKLGTVASVSPTSPDRTIEVDIGGTIYYIHAKTTNN